MGLLQECPQCHYRNSAKRRDCGKCGVVLTRYPERAWWIDYYLEGVRKRERTGPNKQAAHHRLREVLSAKAEGRYIRKSPDRTTRFSDLCQWYLSLPEVQAKRSYRRDLLSVRHLVGYFGDRFLADITPALIEAYRHQRLREPSGRTPATPTAPATVNRELACLKTVFNKAVRNGRAERNPAQGVGMLRENNERDRVLTPEEYARLLAACPPHLKPIVRLAYHTGMRQGEILNLTWGQVDFKRGFIRLKPEHTKTQEGRLVPLDREMVGMLQGMRPGQPLPQLPVFTYRGRPVASIRRAFTKAVRQAGIADFTFHDLRHTYITRKRQEGHDYFRIMAATGHKTLSVFKRYNTVSPEELRRLAG